MRRRDFLQNALVGGAAGTLLAGCGGPEGEQGPAVHTGRKVRWRMASSFPRSLDTIYGAAEVMAERVSAMTDGNFEIRVYSAGELVPGLEVMDAVQQGTVQIGQTASYYYIGKNPALAFDSCVPFGFVARQQAAWLLEGGGLDLVHEMFSDFDILTFPAGNTGVQMGGWFKPEVNSLEDLKGLKMRIPGMGGKVMEALGVATQTIAGGEIFPALERGAIDATEWVGPYDDEKLGFHKVAKNYYYPGWWEPGPSLSFYVHRGAWDSLPSGYQAIIRAACHEASVVMQTRYDEKNPPALQRILASGVQTRRFPDDLMLAAREASLQMLEDAAAKDPGYRKVYEAWKKFRSDSFAWFGVAELAYAQFSFSRE
ncbi:MAG: TRAP transporter substrate-binding protein [Deltaproteobacteria bacterium]|nr:TRAP transporter substrate-binding protein [Deltaproteobacteria bacterium]